MDDSFAYDVFLSHAAQDNSIVRGIAERLRADGLRVWFVESESDGAEPMEASIERGLEQSRVLVLCMSRNSFGDDWPRLERQTSSFRDATDSQRRFIPVSLDDAKIPDVLKRFGHVDLRQSLPDEYARLRTACNTRPADRTVRVWDLHSGTCVAQLEGVSSINGVAVTPDGLRAVSGAADKTVRVWDLLNVTCILALEGHSGYINSVAVTPDGLRAVSGAADKTVRVWDLKTGTCIATLEGHTAPVNSVGFWEDGRRVISGAADMLLRVWDVESQECLTILRGHTEYVNSVVVTPDGRLAISGAADKTVRVWDLKTAMCLATLEGHTDCVTSVAVTPCGRFALSGADDRTVRFWDLGSRTCQAALEGHTRDVTSVALAADGRRALSGSDDGTVRVWDLEKRQCLYTLEGHTDWVRSVALINDTGALAVSLTGGTRLWRNIASENIDFSALATVYTNAKVLLVGESGVGKTALAIRLTENRFEPATFSSDGVHARQVRWATQIRLERDPANGGIERDIWLWDFAGQADYRLIHQLFMDETALAVLVFSPQSANPYEGLGEWDCDLQRAARRPFAKLLVAGRCDRGGLTVSNASVKAFCEQRGYADYIPTSACTGEGCDDLRQAIVRTIPWDSVPRQVSPRVFKRLKDEIVRLKDEGIVLLRKTELRQQLEMRLPGETFTFEQLLAVVRLMASSGLIWQLEFGDFVLIRPEVINSYAAAVIRSVRAHTEEIGCIAEAKVLAGDLDFRDLKRLRADEEQIVLLAMHQTFITYGLCLREQTEKGPLLVFPS